MANSKQSKKRDLQNEKRRDHNKTVRSSMRTAIKKVIGSPTADEARSALPKAMKRIDKAAKTHVIHDNAAARYKSRLQRVIAAK